MTVQLGPKTAIGKEKCFASIISEKRNTQTGFKNSFRAMALMFEKIDKILEHRKVIKD